MSSIFVDHVSKYQVGDIVYVLITLPDRRLAGWTEGRVVAEDEWKNTIASNGEPSPRRFYLVKYGQNSAECHSSPSHGNILPHAKWALDMIQKNGAQWLDPANI